MADYFEMLRCVQRDTDEKTREYPPPAGWGWSLVYRDGVRRPEEDLLVELRGYDPAAVFVENHVKRSHD